MTAPRIFWFRRDLRLSDSRALAAAANGPVVPLFIIDNRLASPSGPNRARWVAESLHALNRDLDSALVIRAGDPAVVLAELAAETGAAEIFATADFGPYGRERDHEVRRRVAEAGLTIHFLDSPYIVTPGSVFNKTGTPFKVFTPFRKTWEEQLDLELAPRVALDLRTAPSTAHIDDLVALSRRSWPALFEGIESVDATLPVAGEAEALRLLAQFRQHVDLYAEQRNNPGLEGTSRLSPHLKVGSIHPRTIVAATAGVGRGSAHYVSEIGWREFYADVMFHHPSSVREVFQNSTRNLEIDRDDAARERFRRWAVGETGYPLVDAGMRQLLAEGWMHNRVRMVCASFLVKHLHLDWRWGARWFMWHLIDGDVASNQHGWQWTAGTGTDAAPYHRVFNPTLQAERFDPDGEYIATYIPELRTQPAKFRTAPGGGDGLFAAPGYVAPMIDAGVERDEALRRFAVARGVDDA